MFQESVLTWVGAEPTGNDFASVQYLDWHGPKPSNPFVNSGAICLCDKIPGDIEARWQWIEHWATRLFNQKLTVNNDIFTSEHATGDRNRALAHLLKSTGSLNSDVESVLINYFRLCSLEITVSQAAYLPMLLANGGIDKTHGSIISRPTLDVVLSIMATCGMYNESGISLVNTGLPAKSGVSGLIVAVALNKAGIAVASPRIDFKGGSVRGQQILRQLSVIKHWHFANRCFSDNI